MNRYASAFVAEPQLVQELTSRARPVDCSMSRVLFLQGEEPVGLYIVQSGDVHVSMCDPDGCRLVDFTAQPGSLLGLPAVVSNSGYSLSAAAASGAQVAFVPRQEFSELMLTQPGTAMMILKVLANEVRTARLAAYKG